jgi:hypothetical protein
VDHSEDSPMRYGMLFAAAVLAALYFTVAPLLARIP